ncbi:helix-turn-helix transcriptional regulator [Paenibacillus radicis (ex Gao et al. 2016)]|uniref:DeoR family transcriptional regulator n=1 Tax=Paenibacillus radicis (ex Gao et al. 2016) TaxID=1737354 RepID=A0A917GQC5_9BACL|nr:YafY family protein [Paenibacillus radicis (ex Gao et al. 2016)]GGG54176.1 DeoR family transcriptional regulator [Paenibacillus radicis (ex Gao et al. 2016)]
MPKSKRLLELMLTINRKRKFTVRELAEEFGVSSRTILRDLQELGELGMPLYSQVGLHGGYQVLNERTLPPIAFTENEAVAIFFASHALRHYPVHPFKAESTSALSKFYLNMPGDTRERIDQMKNRFDLFTPSRAAESPHLTLLLEAAISQHVLSIDYESPKGLTKRMIQPIGIYAESGLWYCPAYCFLRGELRLFRCDRIAAAELAGPDTEPVSLEETHLGNWTAADGNEADYYPFYVELRKEGIPLCEAELGRKTEIHIRPDGSGWIQSVIPKDDLDFFADLFIGLGERAAVSEPPELLALIRSKLQRLMNKYSEV